MTTLATLGQDKNGQILGIDDREGEKVEEQSEVSKMEFIVKNKNVRAAAYDEEFDLLAYVTDDKKLRVESKKNLPDKNLIPTFDKIDVNLGE